MQITFSFNIGFCFFVCLFFEEKNYELTRIRTWNLLIRSQTRYPLRHEPGCTTVWCYYLSASCCYLDIFTCATNWPGMIYLVYELLCFSVCLATCKESAGKRFMFNAALPGTLPDYDNRTLAYIFML